jgi:hypothetical protein
MRDIWRKCSGCKSLDEGVREDPGGKKYEQQVATVLIRRTRASVEGSQGGGKEDYGRHNIRIRVTGRTGGKSRFDFAGGRTEP